MHPVLAILGGAGLAVAATAALGRLAWRSRAPHWTYALAAGAPLLSAILFCLLLTGQAQRTRVLLVCGVAAALLAWRRPGFRWPGKPHWSALVFLPFGGLYLIHGLAPEIQPDAVTYHLGLVAEWVRKGAFGARTGFYDLLPLGLETLFFPAVLVGGFSAAKMVHLALFCATVPLMIRIGQLLGLAPAPSLAAAGLYALAPVAAISGTSAYNDAALVFFSLAVFALLLEDHAIPDNLVLFCAGLAAGFCYAIKITGIVAVAGLLGWLLWKRRWRGCLLAASAASISIVPWMIRNLALTGNPLAPLGNRIFPNDAFHAFNEEYLASYLSDYGGISWRSIPFALGVDGSALQGLYGPVLFLLPLGLLAWRKPAGRAVLAFACILLLPWTRNIGARFLMPAFAMLAIALIMTLPARIAPFLLVAHALLAWPAVLDQYAGAQSWRLRGFPWRAALRLESEARYLDRKLPEYRFTRRAAAHLRDDEPLLDLHALPFAYLNTVPAGPLSSTQFDNIVQTLNLAYGDAPERLYPVTCRLPLTFARAIRIRLEQPLPGPWSMAEVAVYRRGRELPISSRWFLSAWPEAGDAWLAVDRNRATRWSTWERGQAGMFWQLAFDRPAPIDSIHFVLPNFPRATMASVYVQGMDRRWSNVTAAVQIGPPWRMFYRRAAMRFVKRQGFRYIAARIGGDGHGLTGESLASLQEAWGVDVAVREGNLALFRIR